MRPAVSTARAGPRVRSRHGARGVLLHRAAPRTAGLRSGPRLPEGDRTGARRTAVGRYLPEEGTDLCADAPDAKMGRLVVGPSPAGRPPDDDPEGDALRRPLLPRVQPQPAGGLRRTNPGL